MKILHSYAIIAIFFVSLLATGIVSAGDQTTSERLKTITSPLATQIKTPHLVSLYAPCATEKEAKIPVSTLIRGTDGSPLQGVAVTITGYGQEPVFASGVTNENGEFSADLTLSSQLRELTLYAHTESSVTSDPVRIYLF
ncbi:MAG: hypothetical protein JXA44_13975 [Methanospirillaceae archaeon]|nr:hypothetical protein [Methanospirillaceae archaeon]